MDIVSSFVKWRIKQPQTNLREALDEREKDVAQRRSEDLPYLSVIPYDEIQEASSVRTPGGTLILSS